MELAWGMISSGLMKNSSCEVRSLIPTASTPSNCWSTAWICSCNFCHRICRLAACGFCGQHCAAAGGRLAASTSQLAKDLVLNVSLMEWDNVSITQLPDYAITKFTAKANISAPKENQLHETHLDISHSYCSLPRGTTESLPWRSSGEFANNLLALISARVTGVASGLPALILTLGTLGSVASTDSTVAVPTARFSSPV